MFRFEHIEYLYGWGLIPFFILVFWLGMRWRRSAITRFGDRNLILRLIPDYPRFKHQLKFALLMLSLAFLILAMANPQVGSRLEKVKRKGVDVVIAIDVSNSMLAEDVKPNRLERTKQFVSRIIDKLQNDRVGLIVFAGQAYLQMPVTIDYASAKIFLDQVNTELVPTQGTVIGSAIRLAMKSFQEQEKKHKVLIIITDGEGHEDDALGATKEAVEQGVIIHAVGVGSLQGAPIPVYRNNQQVDFKRDGQGNIVLTKLNEIMLQQLAASANGNYYILGNSQDDLKSIIDKIGSVEKKEFEERVFTDYDDKFQYPLAAALVMLILEFFISDRRAKWLDKINFLKQTKQAV